MFKDYRFKDIEKYPKKDSNIREEAKRIITAWQMRLTICGR